MERKVSVFAQWFYDQEEVLLEIDGETVFSDEHIDFGTVIYNHYRLPKYVDEL